MADTANPSVKSPSSPAASGMPVAPPTGAQLRRALLERLRFEQALGVEFVRRVPKPAAQAVSAPATGGTPVLQSAAPQQSGAQAPHSIAGVDLFTPAIAAQQHSGDAAARWQDLEARARACTACVLHKGRTNVVFGCGIRTARLLFVGEGPGEEEDRQGLPFVGRAGQLLNKIIAAMKLTREEVYICNIVKCRPPQNRTPLPDEAATCAPFLFEQIELVAPQVIVALGSPAAKLLLGTEQGIMSLRGKWFNFRGIPLMPTYHPAFVLRRYTEEVRRAVWEDMKQVMAKLASG
ncbi:MAG: uracil-DNA glycosylase [Planctomycetota bacterium]